MTELMSIKQVGHPPPFERPNLFAGEVMIDTDEDFRPWVIHSRGKFQCALSTIVSIFKPQTNISIIASAKAPLSLSSHRLLPQNPSVPDRPFVHPLPTLYDINDSIGLSEEWPVRQIEEEARKRQQSRPYLPRDQHMPTSSVEVMVLRP